jgi:hypothetical protein
MNVCFQHSVVQNTGYLAAKVVHFGVVTNYQKEINITVILDTDYHLMHIHKEFNALLIYKVTTLVTS